MDALIEAHEITKVFPGTVALEKVDFSLMPGEIHAIAGENGAGKSTLMNAYLGRKIAIVSEKPQTTRNRILGVLHRPEAQMVFFDTPGVFQAKDKLNTRIVDTAFSAVADADLILVIAEGRIVETGRHEELLAAGKVYRKLYDLQFKNHPQTVREA